MGVTKEDMEQEILDKSLENQLLENRLSAIAGASKKFRTANHRERFNRYNDLVTTTLGGKELGVASAIKILQKAIEVIGVVAEIKQTKGIGKIFVIPRLVKLAIKCALSFVKTVDREVEKPTEPVGGF